MTDAELSPGTIVATFLEAPDDPLIVSPSAAGSPAHTLALERAGVDLETFDPGGFESVLTVAWGAALVEGRTKAMTVELFALELARLEVEVPDEAVPAANPREPRSAQSPGSRSRSESTRRSSSTAGTATPGGRSSKSSTATSQPKRRTA